MCCQVSSDVCRSFLALHSSHCLEPQVRHVRSFLYNLPPWADEETRDGRDLLQRHCPTLSWQSSAHSLPCWGCMLRSWGAELLPLRETLHGSWVRETPVLPHEPREWVGNDQGRSSPGRSHLEGCLCPTPWRGLRQWRGNWGGVGGQHTKPNGSGSLSSSPVPSGQTEFR